MHVHFDDQMMSVCAGTKDSATSIKRCFQKRLVFPSLRSGPVALAVRARRLVRSAFARR